MFVNSDLNSGGGDTGRCQYLKTDNDIHFNCVEMQINTLLIQEPIMQFAP